MAWSNLLTGVIGGTVGALLTALFNHHRERVKLLTDKLEQVHQQLYISHESCTRIFSMAHRQEDHLTDSVWQTSGAMADGKLGILVKLHFPSLQDECANVIELRFEFFKAASNRASLDELGDMYQSATSAINALQSRILAEAPVLVGRIKPKILAVWCQWCSGSHVQ